MATARAFPNLLALLALSKASSYRIWVFSTNLFVVITLLHLTVLLALIDDHISTESLKIFLYCSSVFSCRIFLISLASGRYIPFMSLFVLISNFPERSASPFCIILYFFHWSLKMLSSGLCIQMNFCLFCLCFFSFSAVQGLRQPFAAISWGWSWFLSQYAGADSSHDNLSNT